MSQFSDALPAELRLEGKHASLLPMWTEHERDLIAAAEDGELWNLSVTRIPDADGMAAMIKDALQKRDSREQLPFVVLRHSDQKIVGSTRYYAINKEHRNLSIGFTWYSKSAQRTAINSECKLLLLTHAFEVASCISVAFHVDDTNTVSQAAVERLGAKHEGILRNHQIMPDGRIRHTYCYSITDTEWPAIKQRLQQRLAES